VYSRIEEEGSLWAEGKRKVVGRTLRESDGESKGGEGKELHFSGKGKISAVLISARVRKKERGRFGVVSHEFLLWE